jgi:hypothetical protein
MPHGLWHWQKPPEVTIFKVFEFGQKWDVRIRWFKNPMGRPDDEAEITIALEPRT